MADRKYFQYLPYVPQTSLNNSTSQNAETASSNTLTSRISTPINHSARYICDLCEYSTETKTNLKKHQLRHNKGEKPFKCTVCPYATNYSSDLTRHFKIHERKSEVLVASMAAAAESAPSAAASAAAAAALVRRRATSNPVESSSLAQGTSTMLVAGGSGVDKRAAKHKWNCHRCPFVGENFSEINRHMQQHHKSTEAPKMMPAYASGGVDEEPQERSNINLQFANKSPKEQPKQQQQDAPIDFQQFLQDTQQSPEELLQQFKDRVQQHVNSQSRKARQKPDFADKIWLEKMRQRFKDHVRPVDAASSSNSNSSSNSGNGSFDSANVSPKIQFSLNKETNIDNEETFKVPLPRDKLVLRDEGESSNEDSPKQKRRKSLSYEDCSLVNDGVTVSQNVSAQGPETGAASNQNIKIRLKFDPETNSATCISKTSAMPMVPKEIPEEEMDDEDEEEEEEERVVEFGEGLYYRSPANSDVADLKAQSVKYRSILPLFNKTPLGTDFCGENNNNNNNSKNNNNFDNESGSNSNNSQYPNIGLGICRSLLASPTTLLLPNAASASTSAATSSYASSSTSPSDFTYPPFNSNDVFPTKALGKFCLVCGDEASGIHYGVITCEACKGFFRRSNQRMLVYRCRRSDACAVTKQTRNDCQSCRMRRCLEVGMDPQRVLDEEGLKRHRRKADENQQKSIEAEEDDDGAGEGRVDEEDGVVEGEEENNNNNSSYVNSISHVYNKNVNKNNNNNINKNNISSYVTNKNIHQTNIDNNDDVNNINIHQTNIDNNNYVKTKNKNFFFKPDGDRMSGYFLTSGGSSVSSEIAKEDVKEEEDEEENGNKREAEPVFAGVQMKAEVKIERELTEVDEFGNVSTIWLQS